MTGILLFLIALTIESQNAVGAETVQIQSNKPIQLAWWEGYYRGGFYRGRYYRPGVHVYDFHDGPVLWAPPQQTLVHCQRECVAGTWGRGVHCVQRCFKN